MLTDHPEADGEFSVFGTIETEPGVVDAIKAKLTGHEPVPFKIEWRGE